MATDPTWTEMMSMSRADIEPLWMKQVELTPPSGLFHGRVMCRIDHPTSRRPLWLWSERVGFEWIPFGIDFDRGLWFFFTPRLAMGRFEARASQSRWRDTDAIGLHYQSSRLPRIVRRVLYDEVKPLSEDLILGIGGIDRGRGEGDHFFFALERVTDSSM